MRTPEIKRTILRMAGKDEFYGYEIHKRLEDREVKIGIGRLYSILAEMKGEGLLKDRWEESKSGPRRRVYQLEKKGVKEREKILMDAIRTVHEFYTEYLSSLPPKHSVFNIVGKILTTGVAKNSNIGYAASRFTLPLRKIISELRKTIPKGGIYAITDNVSKLDLKIDNVTTIEGTFEDLPMKDGFLDLLVVTGNIKRECLDTCLSEWRRVLSNHGVLAIVTPTATITTYEDPVDIGEFIEQREHPQLERNESLNLETLQAEMLRFFKTTEATNVVHITILLGKGSR